MVCSSSSSGSHASMILEDSFVAKEDEMRMNPHTPGLFTAVLKP